MHILNSSYCAGTERPLDDPKSLRPSPLDAGSLMVLERARPLRFLAENGADQRLQETQAIQHERHNSSCVLGIAGNKGHHRSVQRARTGRMLRGISRMQADIRGSPEQTGRKQSCPIVTPLRPCTIKAGRLTPKSALPVRYPQSMHKQGWQWWKPSGAHHCC